MNIFDRLDRVVSRTADAGNGNPFVLTPMKRNPNGRAEVDFDRPIIRGQGILDFVDVEIPVELGNRNRHGNDLRTLLNDTKPILSTDRRHFPTTAQEPRQGDRIEFTDRQEVYQVVSVQRDGLSRLEVQLAR